MDGVEGQQPLGQSGQSWIDHLTSIFSFIPRLIATTENWGLIGTALAVLLALCACYGANQLLNRRALGISRNRDTWNHEKEVVLITGGSSGMGAEMVKKFSAQNVTVISFDINPPQHELSLNAHFYRVDVTSSDAVHEAAEQIRSKFGDPTVLINNAGIVSGNTILDCSREQLERMFRVNLLAHFWLVREFLPPMIKQNHGHVVTMASVASFLTIANNVDYSCVKAGLVAFHEGLTQELKHRYDAKGVLTSIIYPFWVRTPLIKNLVEHSSFKDDVLEPDQVAEAVVAQVVKSKRGEVFVPGYGAVLSGIRGFPTWLQESIRDSKANVLRDTGF